MRLVGNTTANFVSLLPSTSGLVSSSQTGDGFDLSGAVLSSPNSTVGFIVSTPTATAVATLSFPVDDIVMLSMTDFNGNNIPCSNGKAQRNQSTTLSCVFGSYGTLVVAGSIL